MEDPGRAAIGDLKLRVGDAGLLVAIAAICANESHVFIVDDRDGDVELIDPVYNELDIWPSHVAKLDPLPDLDVEAVDLLAEKGTGKQRADDDRQENLFHGLVLPEREARGNVETRDPTQLSINRTELRGFASCKSQMQCSRKLSQLIVEVLRGSSPDGVADHRALWKASQTV